MKYKITANLDFTEDVLELDDDLTEEEIEKELYEYVSSFFDWGYRKVEDEQKKRYQRLAFVADGFQDFYG